MRNLFIPLAFALSLTICALTTCDAQSTAAKPVEPAAIGVVYRLDPTSRELKKLADEQWAETQGSRDPRQILIEVRGGQSTFRIAAAEKIEFVFNTGSPEKVSLYAFEQKKNKRQFQTAKLRVTGGGEMIKGLPVEVSKYGDSSYRLIPTSPLNPGEYGIVIAGAVYTFGVDK